MTHEYATSKTFSQDQSHKYVSVKAHKKSAQTRSEIRMTSTGSVSFLYEVKQPWRNATLAALNKTITKRPNSAQFCYLPVCHFIKLFNTNMTDENGDPTYHNIGAINCRENAKLDVMNYPQQKCLRFINIFLIKRSSRINKNFKFKIV